MKIQINPSGKNNLKYPTSAMFLLQLKVDVTQHIVLANIMNIFHYVARSVYIISIIPFVYCMFVHYKSIREFWILMCVYNLSTRYTYPRPYMSDLGPDWCPLWVLVSVPILPTAVDDATVGTLQYISVSICNQLSNLYIYQRLSIFSILSMLFLEKGAILFFIIGKD